jgi:hypothetical protein
MARVIIALGAACPVPVESLDESLGVLGARARTRGRMESRGSW